MVTNTASTTTTTATTNSTTYTNADESNRASNPGLFEHLLKNLATSTLLPMTHVLDQENLNKMQYQILGEDSVNFFFNFKQQVGLSSSYCSFAKEFDQPDVDYRQKIVLGKEVQEKPETSLTCRSSRSTLYPIDVYASCCAFAQTLASGHSNRISPSSDEKEKPEPNNSSPSAGAYRKGVRDGDLEHWPRT